MKLSCLEKRSLVIKKSFQYKNQNSDPQAASILVWKGERTTLAQNRANGMAIPLLDIACCSNMQDRSIGICYAFKSVFIWGQNYAVNQWQHTFGRVMVIIFLQNPRLLFWCFDVYPQLLEQPKSNFRFVRKSSSAHGLLLTASSSQ